MNTNTNTPKLVSVEVRGCPQWGEIYQTGDRLDVYDPETGTYAGFIEEPKEEVIVVQITSEAE